jgi:peptide/nickel transport system substrate-binding protein
MVHRWIAAAPLCLGLLAAACATPQPAAGPAQPEGASAPATPKVNRLVVAMPPPATEGNNPSRDYGAPGVVQLRPMYEYLMAVDAVSGKRTPQLATEWSIEPDGKSYRFKLRKGVQFQGGFGEMTAKDVTASYADLAGEPSLNPEQPYFKTILEKVEEVNDYEVVLRLTKPDAPFISNISQQLAGLELRSKKAFDAAGATPLGLKGNPIAGTGPYAFKERQEGAYIRFERVNFQHWRATPGFPELELRWVKEASTRLAGLLAGEIQMTPLPTDLQPQAESRGMKTVKGLVPGVRVFLLIRGVYLNDINDPGKGYKYPASPLMDPRVRQALSKAINRDELNKSLLAGKGETLVLNHFNSKREGWNPEWEKRFPDAYGYDPAKAKELLAQAGYGLAKPLKTNLIMATLAELTQSQDVQEAIANYWRSAGVQVELLNVDRTQDATKTRNLEYDNHFAIMVAPSDQFLGSFVYNTYHERARGSVVETPAVDEWYNTKVRPELDEAKRESAWRELGERIFTSYQHIPLFWMPVEMTYNPNVVGEYIFPGSISGLYTHLETVKAAR